MPKNTYPNQRMVCVHREPAKADFLGIKNANWQAAARDLRPFAFLLYLYLGDVYCRCLSVGIGESVLPDIVSCPDADEETVAACLVVWVNGAVKTEVDAVSRVGAFVAAC